MHEKWRVFVNEHCTQWPLKTRYEEALLPLMRLQIQHPVNIEVTEASVCMPNGRQWVLGPRPTRLCECLAGDVHRHVLVHVSL